MAYQTPLTAVSNSTLTAAQWNASVRDNLLETAPAKATAAGRIFVATAANAIAERAVGHASVLTQQTSASASFTNLTTVGPTATITTGTTVICVLSTLQRVDAAGSFAYMGVEVSGASTVAATDSESVVYESGAAADNSQMSYVFPLTGLTAGSNTFTAKYKVAGGGTGTWQNRRIVILPVG
jgi:hypothetical protein